MIAKYASIKIRKPVAAKIPVRSTGGQPRSLSTQFFKFSLDSKIFIAAAIVDYGRRKLGFGK